MSPDDFGNPARLNRRRNDRVRELATPPRGCLRAAMWAAIVAAVTYIGAGAARAQHAPLTCDPACVVRYCEARCSGPMRSEGERDDCRVECVEFVTENGCWPCKENP